jgi:5-hydroxyisourate hydrolase-like protein (transthyretin family)
MSSSITFDEKEFAPATFAGKQFGYSKDYLLLLIKNGKIEGKKVGNKWYVNLPSAEAFFERAEKEKIQKRRQLSIERKLELEEHSAPKVDIYKKTALLETLTIVIIGLTVGATGYMGTSSQVGSVAESDTSFFENLAVSLYRFVSGNEETVIVKTNTPESDMSTSATSTRDEKDNTQPSLVVAPVEHFSATAVESVRDSFSDEVEVTVDPENADTGIVVPKFKDTRGEPYRFLMVPVNQNTGS